MLDLLIVGGGINGCAIARDAAGRGLNVRLVEKGDLASCTSSASTKLIHGGLRYLEHFEFRLVREALAERAVMLATAPHLVSPLTFVLPLEPQLRPAWMIRLGLFLYDHLAPRGRLPPSRGVSLQGTAFGAPLREGLTQGFAYSDCWVDDSRLVIANAISASDLGAIISTRSSLVSAERRADRWIARVDTPEGSEEIEARAIVNAAGPYVSQVLHDALHIKSRKHVRLVKGSHLVTRRLYEGDHAYILQNPDRRVVFVIPYESEFTLIGSTDVPYESAPGPVAISEEETEYLLAAVNRRFRREVTPGDIVSSFAGLRPLFDDGSFEASVVTRDYAFDLDAEGAPALSIFGGKITTARRLAEHALETLEDAFERMAPSWTELTPLAGGEGLDGELAPLLARLRHERPFLPEPLALRLAKAYGERVFRLLGSAQSLGELGEDFGSGLTRHELDYLVAEEWAQTAEDVLWRRSKLGLHMTPSQQESVARAIAQGPYRAESR